ncbi:SurA N-terminal domain-containing protein [Ursidibacter sp. B-7004-1]
MIEKMHEKTNSLTFKIIFTAISISFVLGGIGTVGFFQNDTSAVKVNGQEISQQLFNHQKSQRENALYTQLGGQAGDLLDNPEYAKQFRQAILDGLVNEELIRQYIQELKLGITADQIKSEIVNSGAFNTNGKFDNTLYQQSLQRSRITPDQYAATVRDGMLISQLNEGIINSDFSVPAEKELLAKLLLQKRVARLFTMPIAKEMANQTASEDELKSYYDAHQKEFINPEQVAVEYLIATPKDFENKVQITPEQIETYYQTNKSQFGNIEKKAAHIQVADETTANTIYEQIKNGNEFATLAKEHSTDSITAPNGGDLGWVKNGTFPTAFEDALNSLKVGEFSKPVKIDGAYHIVKVLEQRGSETPLAEVKDRITSIIKSELVAPEYSNAINELKNKAFENSGSLQAAADAVGLTLKKTESFTHNQIPTELNNDKVIKAIFNSELKQSKQNSEAIDITNGDQVATLFLRVTDYQAESTQTFEQAKDTVEQLVKQEKAEKTLLAKAEQEVKLLNAGNNSTVDFGKAEELVFIQAQTTHPVLSQTLFSMAKPSDKPNYQVARDKNGDVLIIALDKVIDGNIEQEGFTMLSNAISQQDQTSLYLTLLNDLREKAKIEINQDFMDELEAQSQK